jgi:carboxypeptidase Q
MDPLHVRTFHAYGQVAGVRRNAASLSARYGAVATIVRSLASNTDAYPHTGNMVYADSFAKIPAVAISTLDADVLSKQLRSDPSLTFFMQTNCRMADSVLSYNVIAEWRGREKPNDYITVGGHLDSWDLGEGAHDDGAGCMQSVDVLRVFKQLEYRPKQTVRIVLFMNEENGLRGAIAYQDSARIRKENHRFALESDAGGFSPRGFAFKCKTPEQFRQISTWRSYLEPYDMALFTPDGGGADISGLFDLGAVLADLRPDSQRYFDVHHAASDVFETVNKRELMLGAFGMASLIYLYSELGL